MVREIITLQFGELSNYVATHFWNAQESYFTYGEERSPVDHNVHWRQGIGAGGEETFLPRTLIYDFRGSFGALGGGNPLYDEGHDPAAHSWHGDPTVHRQPAIPKSAYHDALDQGLPATLAASSVRYWSDFSRAYFHPRSLVRISDLESSASSPAGPTLDTYEQGAELFRSLDADEDVLDRQLRPFVEECDLLQGLQVLGGGDDGWGGFGAAMMDRVRDELGKACVWYWMPEGVSSGGRGKQLSRHVNRARAVSELYTQVNTLIPLTVPSTSHASYTLDPSSKWHLSALLATALESATLPARLLASPPSLSDLSDALNVQGRHTISRLRMGVGNGGADKGGAVDDVLDVDMFGLIGEAGKGGKVYSSSAYGQVLSQRGERSDGDGVYDALSGDPPHPTTTRYTTPLAYPHPDSFPPIFTANSATIDTLLSTDPRISTSATTLRKQVLPFLRGDEREAVGNALAEIGEEYHDGWESEESDDD